MRLLTALRKHRILLQKAREDIDMRMFCRKRIPLFITLVTFLLFFLSACGNTESAESQTQGNTTLVLADFENSSYLRKLAESYQQTHADVSIEIRQYERSDQTEEDGVLLLQREIVSGTGPDLINYGSGYTTSDIVGAYTEDLLPRLTGQGTYYDNILQAFVYQEKLYAVPLGFTLKSFVGAAEHLDHRESWTIREMMACYEAQRDERILYPGEQKIDVFATMMSGSLEYYIDWETGECRFDGEEFCAVMEFCNGFPDHLEITEDFSTKQTYLDDKALLLPISVQDAFDICKAEYIFDDREITFIGFPVESGCGTMIRPSGPVLAINSVSTHSEAAWDFIEWCLGEECQNEMTSGFPINRNALETRLAEAMKTEYETGSDGSQTPVVKDQILFEGDDPEAFYCITQGQADALRSLIETADRSSTTDMEIYKILLEEIEAYFSGQKGLEETADIIQARVAVYINEKIS